MEERKAREERQNEYYELRQSMRRDGDKQEESDKQVLVEATGEEDGYVVKMGDLRAWLEVRACAGKRDEYVVEMGNLTLSRS